MWVKGVRQMKNVSEVRFAVDKRGRTRAYYYSRQCMRWFPIGFEEAKVLVATEQVNDVTAWYNKSFSKLAVVKG
jgi:hypothetical protein